MLVVRKKSDFIIVATPTNYDETTNYFDTKSVESVISNILRDPKKRKQFSRDEVALLTQIREGTPLGNLIGNIAQAGYSLTGGRNVFGGGLAGAGGVVGAAVGATVGDGLTGAAIGVLLEQAATTGVKYIRLRVCFCVFE